MTLRRALGAVLAATIALSPSMSLAQQGNGLIAGKATDEVRPPYSDYSVVIRNATTGQPAGTRALDSEGRFSIPDLPLNQRYLVELVHVKQNRVVCTEGPFGLVAGGLTTKTDVNIDCGKSPALLWLLVAGAGTAALLGTTQASPSR
jgi:hypothetical protein